MTARLGDGVERGPGGERVGVAEDVLGPASS
jgi:hypothetical protein